MFWTHFRSLCACSASISSLGGEYSGGARAGIDGQAATNEPLPLDQSETRRSRSAFAMTETELNVMAALASIGLRRIPKNG